MYHLGDGSFVENSIKRYTIGDRTPGLLINPDGSLDIYIQNEPPQDAKQKASLIGSRHRRGFNLNLRLYVPDDDLQKGTWKPLVIEAVN